MFSELLNDIRQSVVERMFVSMPRVSMMTAVPHPAAAEEGEKAQDTENSGDKTKKLPEKNSGKKAKSKK